MSAVMPRRHRTLTERTAPLVPPRGSRVDALDRLLGRARAARRRGDTRAAIVALREACLRDEHAAAIWTMYGVMLARARHLDEAAQALRHALWLRKTSGDEPRARSTQNLLERIVVPHAA
jgi:Flp pilus assembly protein TadD